MPAQLPLSLRVESGFTFGWGLKRLLLKERASARRMAAATYMPVLARAHLRNLSPLPREELLALKQAVAELGAIGRNLNQIAHVANGSGRIVGPGQDELRSFLKVCEAIRVHVKALLRANLASWALGHNEAASHVQGGRRASSVMMRISAATLLLLGRGDDQERGRLSP